VNTHFAIVDAAGGDFPLIAPSVGSLGTFCTSTCFSFINNVFLPFRHNIQPHGRERERKRERENKEFVK
jgi:hypothetical protein